MKMITELEVILLIYSSFQNFLSLFFFLVFLLTAEYFYQNTEIVYQDLSPIQLFTLLH